MNQRTYRRWRSNNEDGTVWSTDKDGLILGLLAAEITARTGKDPDVHFEELAAEFGMPFYTRIDAQASHEQKSRLKKFSPDAVTATDLAGEPITAKLTQVVRKTTYIPLS